LEKRKPVLKEKKKKDCKGKNSPLFIFNHRFHNTFSFWKKGNKYTAAGFRRQNWRVRQIKNYYRLL